MGLDWTSSRNVGDCCVHIVKGGGGLCLSTKHPWCRSWCTVFPSCRTLRVKMSSSLSYGWCFCSPWCKCKEIPLCISVWLKKYINKLIAVFFILFFVKWISAWACLCSVCIMKDYNFISSCFVQRQDKSPWLPDSINSICIILYNPFTCIIMHLVKLHITSVG